MNDRSLASRARTMAHVAVHMVFYDKLKLAGTLLGVVFAVVLSNQQAGTFLGLIYKNVMFAKNCSADLWVLPPGAETFGPGRVLSMADAMQAKATPGVAWAEPLLVVASQVKLPAGGSEPITVVGVKPPYEAGGPWNLVSTKASVLARPDTMIFEDGDRENLGGLNVGSVREVGGRNITVGGFTWGLIPFGPSYAFADFDVARELSKTPQDRASFVVIKVTEPAKITDVKADLAARLPESVVVTRDEFQRLTIRNLLFKTAIGITFGTSTVFGLIVGFVIVSLSMFSSVVDNIREFGTLKAIGATNIDLMLLLLVQATIFGVIGSVIGLAIVSQMAKGIRSAKLAMSLPPELTFGTAALMVVLCIAASSLALLRLRKVEPAMVFR